MQYWIFADRRKQKYTLGKKLFFLDRWPCQSYAVILQFVFIFMLAACLAPVWLQSACFTSALELSLSISLSLWLFVCFFSQKTSLGCPSVQGSGGQMRAVLPNIYSKHVEILDHMFSVRLVNRLQFSQSLSPFLSIFSIGGPVRVSARDLCREQYLWLLQRMEGGHNQTIIVYFTTKGCPGISYMHQLE